VKENIIKKWRLIMPYGKGTYGRKRGRPTKKKKKSKKKSKKKKKK
tara:strand:- start:356 stop:490 length:135 start_codon:yes stop_codon:yes gene_type:complete